MGILCADLRPQNVLLNSSSFDTIRLTYFYSCSAVDSDICKESIDNCYVAPGNLSIYPIHMLIHLIEKSLRNK